MKSIFCSVTLEKEGGAKMDFFHVDCVKGGIWKWLYYILGVSIVIGLLVALITFFDQIGWNGAFLSLGCLYPFCVIQPAYILWYKMEKTKKWDGGI